MKEIRMIQSYNLYYKKRDCKGKNIKKKFYNFNHKLINNNLK